MKLLKTFSAALLALLLASSCSKYNEGGLISKADKRLTANAWKLQTYYRNGVDETNELLISDFIETFSDNGTLTRSYIDKDGDPFTEEGSWSFDSDKLQINITGVGSVELTDQTSTVSTSDYDILKLKKDELWYTFDNGGDTHEFRFVPQ